VKQVNLHEAQAQAGHGTPGKAEVRPRRLGRFAGEATIHDDFDELPADIAAAFGAAELTASCC
jgi:hypothetical protein